jgi:hypothetical protein
VIDAHSLARLVDWLVRQHGALLTPKAELELSRQLPTPFLASPSKDQERQAKRQATRLRFMLEEESPDRYQISRNQIKCMLLYLGQDYLRRVPMVFLMAVGSGVTAHYFIARTIKFIDDAVGDECAVDKITSLRCVTKLVPLSDVAIFLQGFEVMFAVVVFFVCYCAYSKVAGVTLSPVTMCLIATASATATHWLIAKLSTDLKPLLKEHHRDGGACDSDGVASAGTMPSFDASAFLMRFCEPLMVLVCFYSFTYTYDAFLYDGGTAAASSAEQSSAKKAIAIAAHRISKRAEAR